MKILHNPVREYAWGSLTAIPELLGQKPTGTPQAEVWIGAHPAAPSHLEVEGIERSLVDYIAGAPEARLGAEAAKKFGRLPFLTKILAAGGPLSLQVHPSIEQAKAGFAAEEAAGIPLDAPERNYKDENHKPEMIVALSEFSALSGFRAPAETRRLLEALSAELQEAGVPSDSPALTVIASLDEALGGSDEESALKDAFSLALTGEQSCEAASQIAAALTGRDLAGDWAAELSMFLTLSQEYPGDPGALVALLLNLVQLSPGEAIYLPAGNLHAYLKGLGVEVMATSDNVLRGGLTPKHIDVDELTKTLIFKALPAPYCRPSRTEFTAGIRELFEPPFEEFSVERISFALDGVAPTALRGAGVVLVTEGAATVEGALLEKGQSGFLSADKETAPMVAATAGTEVFLITGAR